MFKRKTKDPGFTLIELLMVISIIGLLSSIVLASLSSAKTKAADAADVASKHEVENALQLYATDHGGFPANTSELLAGNYIKAVDNNIIIYTPLNQNGQECTDSPCLKYTINITPRRSRGGSSNPPSGPSCSGQPTFLPNQGVGGCFLIAGYNYQGLCNSFPGCSWDNTLGCSGNITCKIIPDESSCRGVGCTWN